jgi:hypothetical protein
MNLMFYNFNDFNNLGGGNKKLNARGSTAGGALNGKRPVTSGAN